ncbi:hypothetical protein OAD81_04565 [Flavobacteriaceae bacterium]|jgi:hypothetical protein|nr:hypothetical protein [Flavobacteriaceae bacterium]|tara:strand:- start:1168 stop:1401 length:234 start_codon:yes stop_codon:yes gene_type:complete
MQKGNAPFINLLNNDEHKKDLLIRKNAQRTIDENLWDYYWLRKKYPARFDNWYDKWELAEEQFDPALFPEKYSKKEV